MSTSLLYHSFGIVGYHYVSQRFHGGQVTFRIRQPRERLRCPQCGGDDVWVRGHEERTFRMVPIGAKPAFVTLDVARVWCPSGAPPAIACARSSWALRIPRNATLAPSSATRWSCPGA